MEGSHRRTAKIGESNACRFAFGIAFQSGIDTYGRWHVNLPLLCEMSVGRGSGREFFWNSLLALQAVGANLFWHGSRRSAIVRQLKQNCSILNAGGKRSYALGDVCRPLNRPIVKTNFPRV